MATWMIHLRVADKLLDRIPDLSPIEFIVGNLAPDSGRPGPDGTTFSPSVQVSHFREDAGTGKKRININAYIEQHFTPARRAVYTPQQDAFYLGYLVHLLTDSLWSEQIAAPLLEAYAEDFAQKGQLFWEEVKADWHHQDRLYLKAHPGFRAFRAYLGSVGFQNTFLDFFPRHAFENQRASITGFYLQECPGQKKKNTYLTAEAADFFVNQAVESILAQMKP